MEPKLLRVRTFVWNFCGTWNFFKCGLLCGTLPNLNFGEQPFCGTLGNLNFGEEPFCGTLGAKFPNHPETLLARPHFCSNYWGKKWLFLHWATAKCGSARVQILPQCLARLNWSSCSIPKVRRCSSPVFASNGIGLFDQSSHGKWNSCQHNLRTTFFANIWNSF